MTNKENISREILILKLKIIKSKYLCLSKEDYLCKCTPLESGGKGCVELSETIELLEAMTDNEFDFIRWTYATESRYSKE